jgi:hypothetical protein
MSSWAALDGAEPEFAARLKALFDAHVHKTMATLRRDGSPRISGTEVNFANGELWLGSMPGSRKAQDLQRDGRVAIHSGSEDPPAWRRDAKISGVAQEVLDDETMARYRSHRAETGQPTPETPFQLFRVDIRDAVIVGLNAAGDQLVIETWKEGQPIQTIERV